MALAKESHTTLRHNSEEVLALQGLLRQEEKILFLGKLEYYISSFRTELLKEQI